MDTLKSSWSVLAGAVLAILTFAVCCLAPALLLMLGVGGAWSGWLHSLGKLEPVFIAVAALFLLAAFYSLYLQPRRCAADAACVSPAVRRAQRAVFWAAVVVMAVFLIFF